MPTTVFTATNSLRLFNATDDGKTLTFDLTNTFNADNPTTFDVVDVNDDGNLDSTGSPDYYSNSIFPYSGYTVDINGNTYAIFVDDSTFPPNHFIPYDSAIDDIELSDVPASTSDKSENGMAANFCFLADTRIATPDGEVAVETLTIGDAILTADGRTVPVKWIGRQTVVPDAVNLHLDASRLPVRIDAGALGHGLPHVDLTVSADHGMILDGLVVNASALVNHATIRYAAAAEFPDGFTYYHVETEAHDVILANGAAAETFIDCAGRAAFDNHAEYVALYGADRIIPEMDRPRISSPRHLPRPVKARLGLVEVENDFGDALTA